LFAENGLAVEVDGAVVVLGAIGLVACSLEFGGIVFTILRLVSMDG
jgi:hypothetical protein